MGIFKDKSSKINPAILEEFAKETQDIMMITDYEGNIERANKSNIKENYHTLAAFLERDSNRETVDDMMRQISENGSFRLFTSA